MGEGRIGIFGHRAFTKEQLMKIIDNNFESDRQELIVVISEVEGDDGVFQSIVFGKLLNLEVI